MGNPLGSWIQLRWRPGDPVLWTGPTWAMLCGVISSGGFQSDAPTITRLLLTYFLADPILGAVWSSAVNTHTCLSREKSDLNNSSLAHLSWLPYTLHNSLSAKLRSRLEQVLGHFRDGSPGGISCASLILGTLLSFVLGIVIGEQVFSLTVSSLALAWIGVFVRSGTGRRAIWQVFFPISSAWLLGHAALRLLSWPSVALAGLYAMTVYAYARLADNQDWRGWISLANVAQFLVLPLLVLRGRPLLAGIVALLAWTQWLWQLPLLSRGQHVAYLRRCNVALLASMLIAAWGLSA